MHHVRIAEHEMRARADRPARVLRCIAVVGEHADPVPGSAIDRFAHHLQLGELILRERFRREKIQRATGRIPKNRIQNRRVVAQRLARRRRRDDDDVPAGEGVIDGVGLMRVEPIDAARLKRPRQAVIERGGKRRELGRHGGQLANSGDVQVRRVGAVVIAPADSLQRGIERAVRTGSGRGLHRAHRTSGANKWQMR